ncbi:unannotated protein [freshwater metagenome]|uniref:Unannotated protein n=1 Tax=freshwater metagenome TaxID=449393 RepID=A0A6J7Q1H6_9ZZZZ
MARSGRSRSTTPRAGSTNASQNLSAGSATRHLRSFTAGLVDSGSSAATTRLAINVRRFAVSVEFDIDPPAIEPWMPVNVRSPRPPIAVRTARA